jgi:magnesium transporter
VDKYLKTKIEFGEILKKIEREFTEKHDKETLKKIFSKELLFLEFRQLTESITDVCLNLTKPADNYINNDLIPYFRDIHDHAFRTTEGLKTMLGRMNGMRNIYMSISSTKMNETIRALTIIMALIMPLTVITGFYGMNVKLPMQNNPFAYVYILGIMFISVIIMIILSKKKGWLGKEKFD